MQFPESWLREFCNPPLDSATLAETLTMGGFEVEERRPVAPPFTRIVVGEIPISRLLCVVAPSDDVDCSAPPAQVIQGGELPRRHGGGHKAGPVREQELQPARDRGRMRADQKAIGRMRKIPDQHPVKPGVLVYPGGLGNDRGVEGRAGRGHDL